MLFIYDAGAYPQNAFCKTCITICGKFVPDKGVATGYVGRIQDKSQQNGAYRLQEYFFYRLWHRQTICPFRKITPSLSYQLVFQAASVFPELLLIHRESAVILRISAVKYFQDPGRLQKMLWKVLQLSYQVP